MIYGFSEPSVRNNLPAFFMDFGGPALFAEQKTGIKPSTYNLSRYFTNIVIPAAQKNLVFAAIEDGKIVGYIFADTALNEQFQLEQPLVSGVFTFVLPEYRRKGIATALRTKMLEVLQEQGYKVILCQIFTANETSGASMQKFAKALPHEQFKGYRVQI